MIVHNARTPRLARTSALRIALLTSCRSRTNVVLYDGTAQVLTSLITISVCFQWRCGLPVPQPLGT
jgi:hypothetical protein